MESVIKRVEVDAPHEDLVWRDVFMNSWSEDRKDVAEGHYAECFTEAREDIDMLVLIPVDAANETAETVLYTLNQYAAQTLHKDKWEIVLYLNRPQDTDAENERALHQAIIEFQEQDESGLVIHTVSQIYEEPVTIGRIRSDAADLAFMHEGRPQLMVSHDIDLVEISDEYLERMLETAKDNPDKKLFSAALDFGSKNGGEVTKESPVEDRITQLWVEMMNASRDLSGRFGTTDANTGIPLDAYAAYDGFAYDVDVKVMSEMADLQTRMLDAGQKIHDIDEFPAFERAVGFVDAVTLVSDDRRVAETIRRGEAPVRMTEIGEFSTDGKDIVRGGEAIGAGRELDPESVEKIINVLYEIFGNRVISHAHDGEDARKKINIFDQRIMKKRKELGLAA